MLSNFVDHKSVLNVDFLPIEIDHVVLDVFHQFHRNPIHSMQHLSVTAENTTDQHIVNHYLYLINSFTIISSHCNS